MGRNTNNNSILKTIFSVSTILIFAKALGFVKQVVIANAFGATAETDIISLSQELITSFEYLITQTMITAFIPVYIDVKERCENDYGFTSNVIKILLLGSIAISTLIFIFAPILSRIIAPSYNGTMEVELIKNIRIYAFSLSALVLTAIFNAILKGNKRFLPGEIASVIQSSVFIILVLIVGSKMGTDSLIVCFFVYSGINLLYLGMLSKKMWKVDFKRIHFDKDIKTLMNMISPLLFGYAMLYINQLVDKILASGLGEGTVSALSYTAVLSNFVTGFIVSLCGIAFTYIAQNVSQGSDEKTASFIGYFVNFFVTALIPVSIIAVVNARDIVTIVYGRGAFDELAIQNSTNVLIGYGSLFVPYVLRELFIRVQYCYNDSKSPTINSSISIVCNIVLSILLSKVWGVFGIAIASSIAVGVCAVLNIFSSRKYNKFLKLTTFSNNIIMWSIGGMICFILDSWLKKCLADTHIIIRFMIICFVSLLGYFVFTFPITLSLIKSRHKIID